MFSSLPWTQTIENIGPTSWRVASCFDLVDLLLSLLKLPPTIHRISLILFITSYVMLAPHRKAPFANITLGCGRRWHGGVGHATSTYSFPCGSLTQGPLAVRRRGTQMCHSAPQKTIINKTTHYYTTIPSSPLTPHQARVQELFPGWAKVEVRGAHIGETTCARAMRGRAKKIVVFFPSFYLRFKSVLRGAEIISLHTWWCLLSWRHTGGRI